MQRLFFWVFKGGAQKVKVILGKCKGGGVEIIYIYMTFNLQIFFVLFCKSSKANFFSFGYQGIISYPTFHFFCLLICLVCLSFSS
jgi:hypothetical protein